jgi:hypothetical protein
MDKPSVKFEEKFFSDDSDIRSWDYGIRIGRMILAHMIPIEAEQESWKRSQDEMTAIIKELKAMKIPRQATELDLKAWYAWLEFITRTNIIQGNDPYRGL